MPAAFDFVDPETFFEYLFQATWTCASGSGSNLSVSEALELPWPKLRWWVERIGEQRRAEAAAQRRAAEAASRKT